MPYGKNFVKRKRKKYQLKLFKSHFSGHKLTRHLTITFLGRLAPLCAIHLFSLQYTTLMAASVFVLPSLFSTLPTADFLLFILSQYKRHLRTEAYLSEGSALTPLFRSYKSPYSNLKWSLPEARNFISLMRHSTSQARKSTWHTQGTKVSIK